MRYCAFSGSSWGVRAEYSRTADELGKLLAEDGISLVYGGASVDRSKNAFTHDKRILYPLWVQAFMEQSDLSNSESHRGGTVPWPSGHHRFLIEVQ